MFGRRHARGFLSLSVSPDLALRPCNISKVAELGPFISCVQLLSDYVPLYMNGNALDKDISQKGQELSQCPASDWQEFAIGDDMITRLQNCNR